MESLSNLGFEWDFPAVSVTTPAVVIGDLDFSFAFDELEGTALWQAKSLQASLQQWWSEFRLAVHLSTFSAQQKGSLLIGALALAITLFYAGFSAQEIQTSLPAIQKETTAIAFNEPTVISKEERSPQMCDNEAYAFPVFKEEVPVIQYIAEAEPVVVTAKALPIITEPAIAVTPVVKPKVKKIQTPEEFLTVTQAKAMQEKKLYFLKFGADWCLPCKMMERGAFSDQMVKEKIASTYVKVDLNVDKGMGRRLKNHFAVSALPTIIMFSADGEELARFEQTFTISQMRDMLEMYDIPAYRGDRYNDDMAHVK